MSRAGVGWLRTVLLSVLMVAARVRADDAWPAAGSMADGPEPTHAWIAIPPGPGLDGKAQAGYLVHLPSRRSPPVPESGAKPAAGGALRVAARLRDEPRALAAVEARVYLVFEEPGPEGAGLIRQVASMTAVPAGVGDLWTFEPSDRFSIDAPLPSEGRLAGFAGSPRGPVALIDHHPSASGFELLILENGGWRPVPLPSMVDAPGGPAALVSIRGGIAVILRSAEGPVAAWVGDWPAGVGRADPVWTVRSFGPVDPDGAGPVNTVMQSGGAWVALRYSPGPMTLFGLEGGRWHPLAKPGPSPSEFAAAPMDDSGLLALLWKRETTAQSRSDESGFDLREISALTGRFAYEGPARAKGPVSWSDFRLLALILLGVMTIVLLIVVRSEPGQAPPVLAGGFSLAEPGHRWAAALVDAVVFGSAALFLWDVPLREVINPAWVISSRGEWVLLTWLGLGFAVCTITEAWFGLSPGKALTGSLVVSTRPGPERARGVGLRAAAMRNVIKWFLPPVATIGVLSPDSRHFGDVISGTAVAVRERPEPRA